MQRIVEETAPASAFSASGDLVCKPIWHAPALRIAAVPAAQKNTVNRNLDNFFSNNSGS